MATKTMRAAVFDGPEKMAVRDVPAPACAADGVLVRVELCGICGGDVRNFYQGLRADVGSQIIGHEIVGRVVEAGPRQNRFREGDRVALAPDVSCGKCAYCRQGLVNLCLDHKMLGTHFPGGFAQYVGAPGFVLERGFIERIPDTLRDEDAVMAEPAASVVACQRRADVQIGDTVAVIGDGPIGCLHVEVARARGARQVLLAGIGRLEMAERFAPDALIDASRQDTVAEVLARTGGLGADVVVCANPVTSTQEQAVEMARRRGRIVFFGGVPKSAPMTALDSNRIHYNELTIMGSFSYPARGLRDALQYLDGGKITASKYVTATVGLGDIVEGIALSRRGGALKVAVDPWKE